MLKLSHSWGRMYCICLVIEPDTGELCVPHVSHTHSPPSPHMWEMCEPTVRSQKGENWGEFKDLVKFGL
jgi:hypothetical protein